MRRLACLISAAALIAVPALAQPQPQPQPQVGTTRSTGIKATKNPDDAPAGTYSLDTRQVSVQLRVLHDGGFSYSVFRMGSVAGVLSWDPVQIENSKVNIRIEAKSLQTNVPGFADQLTGPNFLNAPLFPDAGFVSTSVKRTGPTTGQVTGAFTLHGVTRPLTLETELVGAGTALRGPTIGFHAHGTFHRSDFGVGPISPVIGDDVEVIIDLEFDKNA